MLTLVVIQGEKGGGQDCISGLVLKLSVWKLEFLIFSAGLMHGEI